MGKRYLDIKPGSLEDAITKVEDLSKKDKSAVKDVIKGLKKASDLHKQQHQKLAKALQNEKLSPKQKKLDVNKNGKIDGSDLAKLRAKKEDHSGDTVLPKNAVEKDPLDIKSKAPEKKLTDNKTKSDKVEVNPKIDYQV